MCVCVCTRACVCVRMDARAHWSNQPQIHFISQMTKSYVLDFVRGGGGGGRGRG